jgi:gliding motility-associated-like protein
MKNFCLGVIILGFHLSLCFPVLAQTNQTVVNGALTTAATISATGCAYTWTNDKPGIGLAASGTGDIAAFTAVNTTSNPIVATITATPVNSGFAYIANGSDNNVSVINISTNAVVAHVPVGTYPFAVAVSPDGGRVYVANEGGNTISVIGTATNTVIATIFVGIYPQRLVVSKDGSKLYVTCGSSYTNSTTYTDGYIAVINTATNTVADEITSAVNVADLAVSLDGSFLYATNASTNKVIIINTATKAVVNTLNTGLIPNGIKLSPDGSKVYVANQGSNTVSVISTITQTITNTISLTGATPWGVSISPDGKRVYVSGWGSNNIYVIDAVANNVVATVNAGSFPEGISVTPDGSKVYVTNDFSNNVSVLNTTNNNLIKTIPVGNNPHSDGSFITQGCGASFSFTITVNPGSTISFSGAPASVSTTYGTASVSTSFVIRGYNLTGDVLVTPPAGFEVSTDNVTFNPTTSVSASTPVRIYIRLVSTAIVGSYAGNVVLSSAGTSSVNVPMPSSKVSQAVLTITANNKSKVYGAILTGGAGKTDFTCNGLQNDETVSSVTINYGIGAVSTTPAGKFTGAVQINNAVGSFTATNYTITYVDGDLTVNKASLMITADDKTKFYGATNPLLTATYSGFVNNESVDVLTIKPKIVTSATETSAIGNYTIIVSGAFAANYYFTYIPGVLSVLLDNDKILIPNVFTPNGDGINDIWIITGLINYPNCTVTVFNRAGSTVYKSIGYAKAWDGTYRGNLLPIGTYYYIIDLQNNLKSLAGSLTIIR